MPRGGIHRWIAALLAGILGLAILLLTGTAANAGPPEKFESTEAEASNSGETQGASTSLPDEDETGMDRGDENVPTDKPSSQDGNNGCGNEDEPKTVREDDNNGLCAGGDAGVGVTTEPEGPNVESTPPAQVDGEGVLGIAVKSETEVLGTRVTREADESGVEVLGLRLARTGAPLFAFAGVGMLLAIGGTALVRRMR